MNDFGYESPTGSHKAHARYEYDIFNSNLAPNSYRAQEFVQQVISKCLRISKNKNSNNENCVKAKVANEYLKNLKVGAYSCSKGWEFVRKRLAEKLSYKDEMDVSEDDIFITYGGLDAYQHILSLFQPGDTVSLSLLINF